MFAKHLFTSHALPRDVRMLLLMQGAMNASHFMTVPLLALHMSITLHFSSLELGTVMSVNLISAQALPLIVGPIADRVGSRRVMAVGLWLRAMGFVGFSISSGAIAWTCFALAAGAGVACYETAVYATFARLPKSLFSDVFTSNNQMLNLGTMLGPMIGGLAGLVDARFAFTASAALFGLLGLAAFRLRGAHPDVTTQHPMLSNLRVTIGDRNLWNLIAAALPWFFLFPQLYVAFPLHAGRLAGTHAASAIYVVNGAVGLSFMVCARRWLARLDPLVAIKYAYLAAAFAFASVAAMDFIGWFLLFVAGYTVIETIMLPSIETTAASLAAEESQGTFFGILSAAGSLSGVAGYFAGSWLVANRTTFETWAAFGAVAVIGFALSARLNSDASCRAATD